MNNVPTHIAISTRMPISLHPEYKLIYSDVGVWIWKANSERHGSHDLSSNFWAVAELAKAAEPTFLTSCSISALPDMRAQQDKAHV